MKWQAAQGLKSGAWCGSKEEIGPAAYGSPSPAEHTPPWFWGQRETVPQTRLCHAQLDMGVEEGDLWSGTDATLLVLKGDAPMGDSGENHHIMNYQLQREVSSVKLCCFHLARALECKCSGAAYYMHITPSKTNLKHLNTTLMINYFQEEHSVQNTLIIHQHCCRVVTSSTASLQQNSYILMFHRFCRYINSWVYL